MTRANQSIISINRLYKGKGINFCVLLLLMTNFLTDRQIINSEVSESEKLLLLLLLLSVAIPPLSFFLLLFSGVGALIKVTSVINFDMGRDARKHAFGFLVCLIRFFTSHQQSCSRTQRSDAGEVRTRGPLVSSKALYH